MARPASRLRELAATDPGRQRLKNASMIAGNVILSAGITYLLVRFAGFPQDLLVLAGIVGMLSMASVKDPNPRARVLTTVLVLLPAVASACVAASLAKYRIAEIAVFIAISGVAIWVRRYGPRGGSLGMIGFYTYFMVLLTRIDLSQLPHLLAVVGVTLGSAITLRLLMLREHPRRQITLLIHQFRVASAAVIVAANEAGPDSHRSAKALARLDSVALEISDWQHRFVTERHVGATAEDLARQVFDAQISTEQAASALGTVPRPLPESVTEILETAAIALSNLTAIDLVERLTDEAGRRAGDLDLARPGGVTTLVLSRYLEMHRRLYVTLHREPLGEAAAAATSEAADPAAGDPDAGTADPDRAAAGGSGPDTPASGTPASTTPASGTAVSNTPASDTALVDAPGPATTAEPDPGHRDWRFWQGWAPTSRMAAQVVLATALATVTGEAISATRWYWAVLTAFIVFVGTTTRAGILTRAWNRVWGTVVGVGIGAAVVYLTDHHVFAELVLCVVCVFLAFYFGPLRYAWTVLFITVMLASLFDLLGVLTPEVLEVRIVETLVGSVIGVACAYLLFSSHSRPALINAITAYFDALHRLLDEVGTALVRPDHTAPVLRASRDLDRELAAVEAAAATMAVASIGPHATAKTAALHLRETTRTARRLGEAALALTTRPDELFAGPAADRIGWAIGHAEDSADQACATLTEPHTHVEADIAETQIMHLLAELDLGAQSRAGEAIISLSRLNRTLLAVARIEPGAGWHLPHWLPVGHPATAPH